MCFTLCNTLMGLSHKKTTIVTASLLQTEVMHGEK